MNEYEEGIITLELLIIAIEILCLVIFSGIFPLQI
jgi:hypothetical protein